jgi:exopolyphosphatase/pppGpp-phosphohydrolase
MRTINRTPTPNLGSLEIVHSPEALRDQSGIGADDERDGHERQPLLTLGIAGVVNHLAAAEHRAETITEKTVMGTMMSPADFDRLTAAIASTRRLLGSLLLSQDRAQVIGRAAAVVAAAVQSSVRIALEGNERLSISGRVVDGDSE